MRIELTKQQSYDILLHLCAFNDAELADAVCLILIKESVFSLEEIGEVSADRRGIMVRLSDGHVYKIVSDARRFRRRSP